MCGIAGIWHLNNKQLPQETLRHFTDAIAHRGPDGSGYELLDNQTLGFGHRRLSILDLSDAGKQPMFSHDTRFVITFNGEIYNFIEIKKELEQKGHAFHTQTDTEVILQAYLEWGKNCLHKFNGMFALAIWDQQEKRLFMARDRFGVKPCYYLYLPGQLFAFCSETIAFKYLNDFKREIDAGHFNLALQHPEILEGSEFTIFKHIRQLLPGHTLELSKDSSPKCEKWWDTSLHLVKVPSSYEEQTQQFLHLFEDACKLRMRSDVTLASALSGGLDSSSVYCTLHKISKQSTSLERVPHNWQRAFVATFPGTTVDERQYAEQVVQHIKGSAVYLVPEHKNLTNEIIRATKLFDGIISTPLNSISDIYRGMKENGVTVSMDGHGVDEMMYGYNSYVYQAMYDAIGMKEFDLATSYARILSEISPVYQFDKLKKQIDSFNISIAQKILNKLRPGKGMVQHTSQPSSEEAWMDRAGRVTIEAIRQTYYAPPHMSGAERDMYLDFHYQSLPINLRDFDRASMQHGIEIRMPFMDYRLVSYVFSLPRESKIGGGFTKRILRDAMKNTLPENIRARKLKIGIAAPMQEWMNKELKSFVMDSTHSATFLNSTHWNGKVVSNSIEEAYHNNTMDKALGAKAWRILNAHILLND